jgi:hypothetical protein
MSEPWVFGQRCVVVEHDPVTRYPLEGGKVIRAVACQFGLNGGIEVVADEQVPGARMVFRVTGWIDADEDEPAFMRWRLMTPADAEQAGAEF